MNKTMTVIVNGKQEQRPVSHQQQNPRTLMFEDQPITKPGERIERLVSGEVIIIGGTH